MKGEISISALSYFFKEHASPFLREKRKIIAQFIFNFSFFVIGFWFNIYERAELVEVKNVLVDSRWQLVLAGIFITAIYIMLQGLMYVFSFAAIRKKVSLVDSIILFIKRNFISVFLPAGGISSLAFYTRAIEKKGIKKTQIYFASTIYKFT